MYERVKRVHDVKVIDYSYHLATSRLEGHPHWSRERDRVVTSV